MSQVRGKTCPECHEPPNFLHTGWCSIGAKEDRQHRTAGMVKCSCGNVVRLGSTMCGRCEAANDEEVEKAQLLRRIHSADTLDELREVVVLLAERVLK